MADSYVERVAGELADLALADAAANNDENIVDVIGEILGASSQTLQEAFLTAVRVRRAEERARKLLASRVRQQDGDAPVTAGAPIAEAKPDATEPEAEPAPEPEKETQSEADAAFEDALNTLDDFLHEDDAAPDVPAGIQPSRPSRS